MAKSKRSKKKPTSKPAELPAPKNDAASMSSDEDDWEEVEEKKLDLSISKKDVEIEFDLPDVVQKQRKKKTSQDWILAFVKRCMNKNIKDRQIAIHKVHLLCLLHVGFQLNKVGSSEELQALALSLLPFKYVKQSTLTTVDRITSLVHWINSKYTSGNNRVTLKNNGMKDIPDKESHLQHCIENEKVEQKLDLVLLHLTTFRALGLQVRFVFSIHPLSFKPPKYPEVERKALKLAMQLEKVKNITANQCEVVEDLLTRIQLVDVKTDTKVEKPIPQVDGACDDVDRENPRRSTRKRGAVAPKKNAKENMPKCKKEELSETAQKETKSKYTFKDKSTNLVADAKGDNFRKNSQKRNLKRITSPAKKLSEMMSNDLVTPMSDSETNEKKSKPNHSISMNPGEDAIKVEPMEVNVQNKENDAIQPKKRRRKATKVKPAPEESMESDHDSSDFEVSPPKRKKTTTKLKSNITKKSKKTLDSHSDDDDDFVPDKKQKSDEESDFEVDSETNSQATRPSQLKKATSKKVVKKVQKPKPNSVNNGRSVNEWIEVYVPKLGWVTVDCVTGTVNKPEEIEKNASTPVHYVIGFDGRNCVKDVTSRYASQWLIATRKIRIGYLDKDWWKNVLSQYKTKNKHQDTEENQQLEKKLLSQPMPTSIGAFKSHPLFVLRRHLLKYEAIYPQDVPTLGYIRSEEVLPRSAVHCLHTKEKWLQSALSVRDGEQPYKMVASYLLNKKLHRNSDAPSLALFGEWQCDPYQPPIAKDGKVPRNDFGNVDLYQPSMLPIGCVHMRLPNLNAVAKKLNIDIASAVVGFDTHHGFPHPTLDGYVVCSEFENVLTEAWEEEEALAAERAYNKLQERVLKHWKLLFRGIVSLDRLRTRYKEEDTVSLDQVQPASEEGSSKSDITESSAWQTKRLKDEKDKQKPKSRTRAVRKKREKEALPFEVETI